MFASLTDYKLGVEDDSDLGEKYMLRIMDEVISDFDKVQLSKLFFKVSKPPASHCQFGFNIISL